MPLPEKGNYTEIKYRDEVLGYAFRTRTHVNPVFISPAHLITHKESLYIVQHCAVKYRLPEPTRLAHQLVNQLRRGEIEEGVKKFDY
jgi:deoxyribonuclease V